MKNSFKKLLSTSMRNPREVFNLIMNLPKILKLYFRLIKDNRVPLTLKSLLVLAVLYVISPFDLIPDFFVPIFGITDDLIILITAARYFLKKCPPAVVAEHVTAIEAGA